MPFDQLALLGSGSVMRGYVHGRYRDRDFAAAQLEYRTPVVGRFGVAAFAGAGTVAPTISELGSSAVLPTFGAGARWLLLPKERTTIRVDWPLEQAEQCQAWLREVAGVMQSPPLR